MKKNLIRLLCVLILSVWIASLLSLSAFATEFLDYKKYKADPAYDVECIIEKKTTYYERSQLNWSTEHLQNGGEINGTYRLIQLGSSYYYNKTVYSQPVTFRFEIPRLYTEYYTEGRTYEKVDDEWYGADYENRGQAHKYSSVQKEGRDTYMWYRNAQYEGDQPGTPGNYIQSYLSASLTCGPRSVGVFTDADLKRWGKTWEEYLEEQRITYSTNNDALPHEKDRFTFKETKLNNGVMFETYQYDWIERPNANGTGTFKGNGDVIVNRIEALGNEQETWQTVIFFKSDAYPGFYFVAGCTVGTYLWYDNGTVADDKTTTALYNEFLERKNYTVNTIYPALQSALAPKVTVGEGSGTIVPATVNYEAIVSAEAKSESGEDGGTTIPAIIILGTLGVGAALAGAAAAVAAAEDGKKEDDKKRSSFKMYINKDFGDTLKKGLNPQAVYARITEIKPTGEEIDRPDLTKTILVGSSDDSLTVTDGGMTANGYRCAMVSVPDTAEPRPEGIVTFRFEGEGGSYTQNVIFKILGDCSITFPDKKPEDAVFVKKGLLGDSKEYLVEFVPENFANPPESFKLTSQSDKIEVVYKPSRLGKHYAAIKNKTVAPEVTRTHYDATADYGEHNVLSSSAFAKSEEAEIHILAENKEEKTEVDFKIEFYPEGISVKLIKGEVRDNKLIIDTQDENGVFKPVELEFIRTSKLPSGNVQVDNDVDVEECLTLIEGKDDSESVNVIYGFKHKVEAFTHEGKKAYRLMPEVAIPDNGHDCYTFKWSAISAGSGQAFRLDLPVRLTGEKLDLAPVEERNKEIALLKRAIERYGLHNDAQATSLVDNLEELPASVIKQMRAQVLRCAIEYYSEEARKEANFANYMSVGMYSCMFFDWLGQQAFSYILKVYVGDVGEMLITPLKNAIVGAAADNLHSFIWGEPYQDHFTYEKVVGIFEEMAENFLIDALFGNIDWSDLSNAGREGAKLLKNFSLNNAKSALLKVFGADYSDKLKKGACFCAAFCSLNFAKHYYLDEETKGDFGKAIVATFNDCSMNTLKQVFSKFVTNWLKKKYGLSEISRNSEGGMTVDTYTVAPLEKYIKSKLTVGDIQLFGKQLTGTEFLAFGKKYDFFKTTGDNTGTLVGVGVDALTGAIVDAAPDVLSGIWKAFWDSSIGGFIICAGGKLYALTIKGFVEACFKQITEYYEAAKFTLSKTIPIPSFIPSSDSPKEKEA
ncbi:MAG: hypothetical protein IJR88_02605 [Clostridia bacterium]|nr:hypothetical protein [Clostridia bacterium]